MKANYNSILYLLVPILVVGALVVIPVSASALEIRVRARTALSLDVESAGERVRVWGSLVDDNQEPMPLEEIRIEGPGGWTETVETDDLGRFSFETRLEEPAGIGEAGSSMRFSAFYVGDSRFGPAEVVKSVDIEKASLRLGIYANPPRGRLHEDPVAVVIDAKSGEIPVRGHSLRIRLPDGTIQEEETNDRGEVHLSLASPSTPGRYRVEVMSKPTLRYNGARAERIVAWVGRSEITMETSWGEDGSLNIQGHLDVEGGTEAPEPIEIVRNGETAEVILTDPSGDFSLTWGDDEVTDIFGGERRLELRAYYRPHLGWIDPSDTGPLWVERPVAPSIPISFYLVPLALLLGVATLVRVKSYLAERADGVPDALKDTAGRVVVEFLPGGPEGGGQKTQPGIRGLLWDPHTKSGVGGGAVQLLTGSGELVEESSADLSGDFSLRGQAGDYSLLALAPGYLPQVVAVSLPHDGRLHGFRVHLRAIRVETLSLYEAFLTPYWPQGSPWGELTPREAQRELLRRVRREQLLLREMTTLVESAYFSGEHPTAETLERIRELAKTVATAMEGRPA